MFSAFTNSWAWERLLRLKTQAVNSLLRRKNIAALDPVNARDVLKVDNLDMLAARKCPS